MSWCERKRRFAILGALAVTGMTVLAGCETTGIHPLYMSHGGTLQAELQAIVVDPVPDRLGHYLGDALQTSLNGTGSTVAPKYHLTVIPRERVQTPLIDTVTSRAQAASVITDVNFTLRPVGGGPAIFTGTASSAASYDRSVQRFANIRAARDAEIRNAKTLADEITQQIASQLATQ